MPSKQRTIFLDTNDEFSLVDVGGKTKGLITLNQSGLPVPPGFCVKASAYQKHLDGNGLTPKIKSAIKKLKQSPVDERQTQLEKISLAIIEAPLEETLREEIETGCRRLELDRVAVRSSATAEDLPDRSFAGQHGTFFVVGFASVLDAVKDCWASLWTERAYAYRETNGFDHLAVGMAVIIQEMIDAGSSGVMFTADPVSSRADRIVIESCFGLGEALVSGRVTPDRYILDKKDLTVIKREISRKNIEIKADKTGKVREQTIGRSRQDQSSLDESILHTLGEYALKIEQVFGLPQDIEWAVHKGEMFFLQSRPITTIRKEKSFEDRQVWSNINTGEILPDVVSPMTWSLLEVMVEPIFRSLFGALGVNIRNNPLIGQVAGRVYFNLNTLAAAIKSFPGMKKMDLNAILGGEQGKMEELGHLKIPEEDLPDLRFNPLLLIVRAPVIIFNILSYSPKKGAKFIKRMSKKGEQLLGQDFSKLSDDELLSNIKRACDDISKHINGLGFAFQGMFYFTQLDSVCRKWLGDVGGTFANLMLTGMGNMESAKSGLALWRLAVKAHENSLVEETILKGNSWEETRDEITGMQGGTDFLSRWDIFMSEYGHHTRAELDMFNPRWSDSPDYILDIVRSYLRCMKDTDPIEHSRERVREREELIRESRKRLKNPIKRAIFNFYLSRAQLGSTVRENLKNTAIRYWINGLRLLALETGKRLTERGLLEEKEDIFFLRFDELELVIKRAEEFDAKKVVAARRSEFEKNSKITPSAVIIGQFDPDNLVPEKMEPGTEQLSGIAVSPGVVTGPARVILRADDDQVLPGEILVAPFTDPGWTPYFIPAAAIVMDQGGLLSHGSIVAREYGIPAVVNVGPATKLIKTGQTIQVDGNRGLVTVVEKNTGKTGGRP